MNTCVVYIHYIYLYQQNEITMTEFQEGTEAMKKIMLETFQNYLDMPLSAQSKVDLFQRYVSLAKEEQTKSEENA